MDKRKYEIRSDIIHYSKIGLALLMMVLLLVRPERYMHAVRDALLIFVSSVLPALFPFIFLTSLLTELGTAELIGGMVKKPISALYHTRPIAGYILFMSLVSGYPIGAKLIAELYEQGEIDDRDALSILSFTSMPGPVFLVGTIGVGILHSRMIGYILIASNILAALLNGIIYRRKNTANTTTTQTFRPLIREKPQKSLIILSLECVLQIGGNIVIFYVLAEALESINIVQLLAYIMSKISSIDSKICEGIMLSLVEMTRGMSRIATISQISTKIGVTSGIIAFGGLSIMAQSMTYLSRAKIKVSHYLTIKLTQSLLSFSIAMLISLILLT